MIIPGCQITPSKLLVQSHFQTSEDHSAKGHGNGKGDGLGISDLLELHGTIRTECVVASI